VSAFVCVLTLGMLLGPGSEVVAYEPVYRTADGRVWILGHYPVRLLVLGPAEKPGWLLGRNVGDVVWWRKRGPYWDRDDNYYYPRLHPFRAAYIRWRDVIRLVPPGCDGDS
jgi:hypothetical protein